MRSPGCPAATLRAWASTTRKGTAIWPSSQAQADTALRAITPSKVAAFVGEAARKGMHAATGKVAAMQVKRMRQTKGIFCNQDKGDQMPVRTTSPR